MNRITCDIIRDLLPLYIDGVCSADSRALAEEHLQSCPACKAEYEKLSHREFLYDAKEKEVLTELSKRWKKGKRKTLFAGIVIALAAVLLVGFVVFGCSAKVIPADEVTVSSLSRLENGDLAFILQAADGTGIREFSHYEMDGKLCITATTTRISFFSASESSQSGWIINTQDTGIQQICYQDQNGAAFTELPIWDAKDPVDDADTQAQERIKGMEKLEDLGSDALVEEIYQKRVTYIGSPSDDMKLLGAMRVGEILGPFSIRLITSSEPYGIILDFKDPVAPAECDAFDAKMRAYATVILAMIDNSGTVGWTYTSYDQAGKETELARDFGLEDAKTLAGADIKRFGANEAALRELCDLLGLY